MAGRTPPWPALWPHPPQAFPARLALHAPVSLAGCAPGVGPSEPVTCPRAPGRWVAAWRPLARQQRRVRRRLGAAATGDTWRPAVPPPAGLGVARTAQEPSIGKATQHTSALPPGGGDGLDHPCLQDLRQAYIGAHGRKASAWRRPRGGVPERSRLPPARVQPLATQSASASSTASLLEPLPPRPPVHGWRSKPPLPSASTRQGLGNVRPGSRRSCSAC